MNTWTPLWSKIVDSSLWEEQDFVVKVFITMMAKKDADDICRGSAYNIANWSRKTEAETLEALKILSSPDTKRLEPQPYEGRRIEKVEDGYLILNSKYYKEMMSKMYRREYQREKQAEYRAVKTVSVGQQKHFIKPTQPEIVAEGLSDLEADKFLAYYESNGWRVGRNPMKSWKAAVAGWKTRLASYSNGDANSKGPSNNAVTPKFKTKEEEQRWIFENCQ